MIVDPNNFNMLSSTPGLGSDEYIDTSFSIGAQSVGAGTTYQNPKVFLSSVPIEYLASLQIQLSGLETIWRPLKGWNTWAFNTSNQIYYVSTNTSASNANTNFRILALVTFTQSGLGVVINYLNDRNPSATASVPAITYNVRAYFYTAPL